MPTTGTSLVCEGLMCVDRQRNAAAAAEPKHVVATQHLVITPLMASGNFRTNTTRNGKGLDWFRVGHLVIPGRVQRETE